MHDLNDFNISQYVEPCQLHSARLNHDDLLLRPINLSHCIKYDNFYFARVCKTWNAIPYESGIWNFLPWAIIML